MPKSEGILSYLLPIAAADNIPCYFLVGAVNIFCNCQGGGACPPFLLLHDSTAETYQVGQHGVNEILVR